MQTFFPALAPDSGSDDEDEEEGRARLLAAYGYGEDLSRPPAGWRD